MDAVMTYGAHIWEEVKRLFPEHKNIIFLPYKAEMWDCMDSVYDAAVADPEVEHVDVCGLPYFIRGIDIPNVDTFPHNVTQTADSKYDIAFIHNIYEDNNLLTRVGVPIKKIREKMADHVVYIPYFVMAGLTDDYINQPGLNQVDAICVDNQDEYAKYAKYTDKPLIVCPSPKREYNKKPAIIPDEWKKKSREHNLLVNTHINPLMINPGRLVGLCELFESYKRRDDVCVIWRPHPLSLATLQIVHPGHVPAWNAVVDYVRTEHIYDDSPDYRAAFQFSTEMLSDPSSLTELYDKRIYSIGA